MIALLMHVLCREREREMWALSLLFEPWNIKVVRRMFETTSIEQLEDGDEQDWERPLSIHFIGEEGIDA